jgi:hypothetical protein
MKLAIAETFSAARRAVIQTKAACRGFPRTPLIMTQFIHRSGAPGQGKFSTTGKKSSNITRPLRPAKYFPDTPPEIRANPPNPGGVFEGLD